MTKIILLTKGFELPRSLVHAYYQSMGVELFYYYVGYGMRMISQTTIDDPSNLVVVTTQDLGNNVPEGQFTNIARNVLAHTELYRTEELLVSLVETSPKKYPEVKVVEIPDGVVWDIVSMDNQEVIQERHRIWC